MRPLMAHIRGGGFSLLRGSPQGPLHSIREKQMGGVQGSGCGLAPSLSARLQSGFLSRCDMQSSISKRYYSPQFSELAAVSVRRLAWALAKPMPAAVDHMVSLLPSLVDPSKVCLSCQDSSRCSSCVFCQQAANPAAVAVLAPQ
jgi:hypothetical protein